MGAVMERRPLARLRVWSIGQCGRRASGGATVLGVGRERSRAPRTQATCVPTLARHRPAGVLAITDQLRPEAPAVATTDRLAIQVGITDVRGALLPDDKVAAVQRLRAGDAVVVRDDLTAIPAVIALSRRARRVVVANLVIAASFIGILVL
jgi:cation transport ATPase